MKKTVIVCGENSSPILKKAVEVLSQTLLDYTKNYPACFKYDCFADYSKYRCIFIGTKSDNLYIAKNSSCTLLTSESYNIFVANDTVIIEGFDDAGVLYGCIDFYNKYILKYEYWADGTNVNIFDKELPDYSYSSAPTVKNRGLWTWGHVIYNYKGYLDNMMKLKMNTLIIWNDFAPINADEIIDYAHSCGIKVIWGFAWGWDTDCKTLSLDSLNNMSQEVFDKFKREYANLNIDGIYFQTITEVKTEYINGVLVADAVTDFVNTTAKLFFNENPNLELQFGLHATSVKNRLEIIKKVDRRIRIVWEDCGAFPFSYNPNDIFSFDETKKFTENIAVLRGINDKFGVVTKGLTKLDWKQFEHLDGPAYIGVGSDSWKNGRIVRKSKAWRYFQAYWMINADKVQEMVRVMAQLKQGDLYITALVEDGMFEENLMFPVAVYSEILWDYNIKLSEIISRVALRANVDFA